MPATLLERSGGRVCPVCRESPLRVDNETGVCGSCQARGVIGNPLAPEVAPRATREATRRSVTLSQRHLVPIVKAARHGLELEFLAGVSRWRPRCRGDCADAPRPCPFVGCKWHLYLDVTPVGSITYNFPGRELWELPETCALDVADRCGITLDQVGELLNVTRERIRQLEERGLLALRRLTPKE